MKTSALVAIFLAVATLLPANNTPDLEFLKCRDLPAGISSDLSAAELVKIDLVNGIWTLDDQLFQFSANGRAEAFVKSREGYISYRSYKWSLEECDHRPVLALSTANDKEKQRLSIEQTCEGILLVNADSKNSLYLKYHSAEEPFRIKMTKDYLVGEWTNVTLFESSRKCENQRGAFLSYLFHANGTYTCEYGSQTARMEENGRWEVSKDGQFLLLYAKAKDANTLSETKVVRIAQVDDHGLILEQAMKTNDISSFFCADVKSFAFIK